MEDFAEPTGARLLFPLPSGARGMLRGTLVLIASSASWNFQCRRYAG